MHAGLAQQYEHRERRGQGSGRQHVDSHARNSAPIWILWPASRHLSPKLRVLIDFLGERLFPCH